MYRMDIKSTACEVSKLLDDFKFFILELWFSQIFLVVINMWFQTFSNLLQSFVYLADNTNRLDTLL